MNKYNSSMFDSIKDALTKQQKQGNGSRDILALEKGNTYVVRLVPNIKDPEKSWFKYQTFSWNSVITGAYTQSLSPLSWGERDPIAEERIKFYKQGSDEVKKKMETLNLRRSEKWLMRAYVVSDPVNPENNGKVKLLRFGKQLFNIINNAIIGEDSDEFGYRVFDFSSSGVNLKIKVTSQGEFANYTESRFTSPVDLKLNEGQIEEIYAAGGGLETIYSCRGYDDIKKLFDEHYHGAIDGPAVATNNARTESVVREQVSQVSAPDEDEDEKIRNLLSGL